MDRLQIRSFHIKKGSFFINHFLPIHPIQSLCVLLKNEPDLAKKKPRVLMSPYSYAEMVCFTNRHHRPFLHKTVTTDVLNKNLTK